MREGRAEIIMESKSVFIAGSTYVADDFDMKDFTHIRAYHGCHPLDIGTYQAKGICSITYEDAKQELLDRFQNSNISPKRLLEVFEKHWEDLKDIQKGVWFTLTKKGAAGRVRTLPDCRERIPAIHCNRTILPV